MLNLRRANQQSKASTETATGNRSTIRFNSDTIIGNLGETLDFRDDNYGHENAADDYSRRAGEYFDDVEGSYGQTTRTPSLHSVGSGDITEVIVLSIDTRSKASHISPQEPRAH